MDLLEEEVLAKVPLLIYANKQDLVSALSQSELAKELNLPSIKNRAWQVGLRERNLFQKIVFLKLFLLPTDPGLLWAYGRRTKGWPELCTEQAEQMIRSCSVWKESSFKFRCHKMLVSYSVIQIIMEHTQLNNYSN